MNIGDVAELKMAKIFLVFNPLASPIQLRYYSR